MFVFSRLLRARPQVHIYVKIESLNRAGETFELEGEGFLARCIQHEIDHLEGILFIDHVQTLGCFTNRRRRAHRSSRRCEAIQSRGFDRPEGESTEESRRNYGK
nr:peptide deformylase [Cohnella faecalis]